MLNTTTNYKTLAFAYGAAEKAGATRFDPTCYEAKVAEILTSTYKFPIKRTLAKWNLTKLENTLYTLECTNRPYAPATFRWVAIGTFDSDGLLYGMSAPKQEEAQKPKTSKPKGTRNAKGSANKTPLQAELDTLAGTGDNSKAHKIMCKHGLKNSKSEEYQAAWRGYWWTIR